MKVKRMYSVECLNSPNAECFFYGLVWILDLSVKCRLAEIMWMSLFETLQKIFFMKFDSEDEGEDKTNETDNHV